MPFGVLNYQFTGSLALIASILRCTGFCCAACTCCASSCSNRLRTAFCMATAFCSATIAVGGGGVGCRGVLAQNGAIKITAKPVSVSSLFICVSVFRARSIAQVRFCIQRLYVRRSIPFPCCSLWPLALSQHCKPLVQRLEKSSTSIGRRLQS